MRRGGTRGGFALLVVLLALLALLVLCAPFLWTANKVDGAASAIESGALARSHLDTAARHARHSLAATHPALDRTPDLDDAGEFSVAPDDLPTFARDERGALWQHRAEDLAGRVDLGSVPPHVIADLWGAHTFLIAPLGLADEEIRVADARGFAQSGHLWIDGEIVRYTTREDGRFRGLTRALLATEDGCGPSIARAHGLGTPVIPQEAWALPMWRTSLEPWRDGGLTPARSLELAGALSIAGAFTPLQIERLLAVGTFHGDIGTRRWQRPVRLLSDVRGGQDCALILSEARHVAPGSTVMVREGRRQEVALVQRVSGDGAVVLLDAMRQSFAGGEAEVHVLAAQPVNVNTAPAEVLVALFENLALGRENERITHSEARELAARVVEGRPWDGFSDLLERLVLPAAGLPVVTRDARGERVPVPPPTGGFLSSVDDAQALWRAVENGNDAELRFATLPLSFVSRDTYGIELRAAQNAPSGVQRAFVERHQIERVAPPGPLLRVWSRQVEFDEELRVHRDAPGWATGPEATSVYDTAFGASPPPRRPASFPKPLEETGEPPAALPPLHPRRDGDAWARPWVARLDESGRRAQRVMHFDRTPNHPEGRVVAREPVALEPTDPRVRWAETGGLARPLTFSMWFQSRTFPEGGVLFDVAGLRQDSDRVSLLVDGGDLVLRVLDAVGDHPTSTFRERGEVRFALAAGDGPGIPAATWTHVEVDVRGNRPDQMAMRVDGLATARTLGLTKLTSPLTPDATAIRVESTEGFPDRCVLRIGEELIEARRTSATTFDASHSISGPEAGFGGRLARERVGFTPTGQVNAGLSKNTAHPAQSPVQLHGYSMPLATNAPSGAGALPTEIGAFAVARVAGVDGASNPQGNPISVQVNTPAGAFSVQIGTGFESGQNVTGLRLAPADAGISTAQMMSAFSPQGGFAAIVQRQVGISTAAPGGQVSAVTPGGRSLFGVELVRYSGREGDVLRIAQWGLGPDTLPGLATEAGQAAVGPIGGQRAFVVRWMALNANQLNADLGSQTFVVPISLAAGNSTAFLPGQPGNSQFAQLTEIDPAERTEWVRYDSIVAGQLVRDDRVGLTWLYQAIARGDLGARVGGAPSGPGGGGGGAGGGGGGSNMVVLEPEPAPLVAPLLAPLVAPNAQGPQPGSAYWKPDLGTAPDDNQPVTRAARTAFQFRGVLGTYSHPHAAGTPVMPVFAVHGGGHFDSSSGWPGRFDHAFVVDANPSDPGWPLVVHRAYRPTDRVVHTWDPAPGLLSTAGGSATVAESRFATTLIRVAAQQALQAPVAPGAGAQAAEIRTTSRLVLFPSGERPRTIDRVTIGASASGGPGMPAVVDEVLFGNSTLGLGYGFGAATEGATLVLATDVSEGATTLRLEPFSFRHPNGVVPVPSGTLGPLPPRAGMLRIGEEWIAYSSVEASGEVRIATDGRGLLASTPQPHRRGQPVQFAEQVTVGILERGIGPDDADLPLTDPADFAAVGTVLVGSELVHHTQWRQGALAMPRRSVEPGVGDARGAGLFRGRFGTTPASHAEGAPVIHFPFRYWDRWADDADAPELHYFAFALDEPDSFVLRAFFEQQETPSRAAVIEVLERTDPSVPWDTPPGSRRGIVRRERADPGRGGAVVGANTSRAEWRAFARWRAGAFDAESGASHGWKEAPQLSLFGIEYLAPGRIYRVEER